MGLRTCWGIIQQTFFGFVLPLAFGIWVGRFGGLVLGLKFVALIYGWFVWACLCVDFVDCGLGGLRGFLGL